MIAAPIGQVLSQDFGWRTGIFGFCAIALLLIPAAWISGRVDKIPVTAHEGATDIDKVSAGVAVRAHREAAAEQVANPQPRQLPRRFPRRLADRGWDGREGRVEVELRAPRPARKGDVMAA